MTTALNGAKAAKKEIEKFHVLLNHDAMIPGQCYRMSHTYYSMVCYTNQVVALFISKNFQMIPLFIGRAYAQLERFEGEPNTEGYRKLVLDYLSQMSFYLTRFATLDEEWFKYHIPEVILNRGERKAPEYDHVTMHIKPLQPVPIKTK